MSKTRRSTNQHKGGRQRRISVRAVRRESPDLRRLGRAVVAMALAQAEAEAAAEAAEAAKRQQSAAADTQAPAPADDGGEAEP